MSSISTLASQYARQLFNLNLDSLRAEKSVAPEGLNSVRQTPVPAVLAKRQSDAFEKQQQPPVSKPVWGQLTTSASNPAAKVGMSQLFRDGFESSKRDPVNLMSGGVHHVDARALASAATVQHAVQASKPNGFSASLEDLPQFA